MMPFFLLRVESLRVKNFRVLRDVALEHIAPLTVLSRARRQRQAIRASKHRFPGQMYSR